MSGPPAAPVGLTPEAVANLRKLVASRDTPQGTVTRARILLLAHEGKSNAEISRLVGVSERTVRKWRGRAGDGSPKQLKDAPRSGRPSRVSAVDRCVIKSLACVPVPDILCRTRWGYETIQRTAKEVYGVKLSVSEIGRILRDADIRPHLHAMWLHSPDPDIYTKAALVCAVYELAKNGATVLSMDEKTGIQALSRRYETRPCAPGRLIRVEYEYRRHGTTTLMACFNVGTGAVHHRLGPTRTAADTVAFLEEVALLYPKGPVYVVWDNLNTHKDGPDERWTQFNARHGNRFHFIFTPIHASWMNQVECWFSILERRVLRGASYTSVDQLTDALNRFIALWNSDEKHPFKWNFRGMTNPEHSRYAA